MLGVTAGRLLGEDELVVKGDLEHAPSGRDDHDVVQVVLELFQQPLRQTDGSRCVPSLSAVLDGYPHEASLGFPLCLIAFVTDTRDLEISRTKGL